MQKSPTGVRFEMAEGGPVDSAPIGVRVFGGMGLAGAEGALSVGGPRQRRLLALLALRNGSVASVDWLAEYLWDDADRPEATAPAIRTYMSRLRQALPAVAQEWLGTGSSGYSLKAPSSALEHLQFADLRVQATSARRGDDPLSALRLLDEALALWRGDPFLELEDSGVARSTVEQLQLDRLEMLEERWESALVLGRHTQITGELAVFAGEHRLRDRATRQYALALHRSGRSPEGLRVIAAHREFLLDEAGLDPSSEMLDLERAMLDGDASLEVEKIGRPLRGYRLLDEIGSGAFSVVWRGVQPSVGREVAIKQIRSELASQPEFIRRFEAEARLIARIEHPHIVPLIDFWRDPDSAYLVMRLLRGGTLERRLDEGPLSIDDTLTLAQQIGGALSEAHAHNIIHRDVKTGNIMFDENGNAFLGDFGIALEASNSTGPAAAFSTGSPAYSAPEQIRQEPLGPPADVFSLGVVLFECVTGTLPFSDSGSVAALVERQLHSDFPPVTDFQADVPPQIVDAIAKATARTATDRFETVSAFLEALGQADDQLVIDPVLGVATNLPNPYLGLSAFDEADRENFFGREALLNALLKRLSGTGLASRCIGVVGPSGSGKSSVVRAGLSPALRQGTVPGSEQWFTTTMVPGSNPFESLEAALLRIAVNPPASLLDQLQDGRRGVLRCLRRCLGGDDDKIYVVIDQFEEIFTSSDQQIAFDFLDALAVAVEDPQSPLRLVFTLRADYYDRPLAHPSFARILDAASVNVTPLSADELERAMVGPAQRFRVGFEPGLVALIVADCIGQPAPLPLLQYALSELFNRRDGALLTIDAYEDLGRLTGALAGRAETIHDAATEAQRSAVRRTFGRMISPTEEAADLRRRVRLGDLGDDPDTTWVLEHFGAARLVAFDRDPASREPTVEVAHEALLREWPRLASWLDEDRDVLRSSGAVALAADAWDDSGRPDTDLYRGGRLENAVGLTIGAPDRLRPIDAEFVAASQRSAETERNTEQRRVRRLRQGIASIAVALVVALIAGGVASTQQGRANEQADRAEAQAELAEIEAAVAAQQTQIAEAQTALADRRVQEAEVATLLLQSNTVAADDGELSILLALEAHRRVPDSESEQAVLRALTSSRSLISPVASFDVFDHAFKEVGCSSADILINSMGVTMSFVEAGELTSLDPLTEGETTHGPAPSPCVNWFGDLDLDRRIAYSEEGRMWLGSYDGTWDVERDFGNQIAPVRFSGFNAAHRLLFWSFRDGRQAVVIIDDLTGQTVGTPITGPGRQTAAEMSSDGAFVAVGFNGDAGEDTAATVLVDALTGTELFRFTGRVVETFGFDLVAQELLVGTADRSLMTFDLLTGEELSTFRTSATSDLEDISVREDGSIVVSSRNQVEIFDRRTGSTGETFEISDRFFVQLRPDGKLFTTTANRTEIFDLALPEIADRTIDLAAPTFATFGDGSVVVVDHQTSRFDSIDLATGDRVEVVFNTADGEGFRPDLVAPHQRGFLAVTEDGQITRWQDGVMIEQIDPSDDRAVRAFDLFVRDGTLIVAAEKLSEVGAVGAALEFWVIDARPGELEHLTTVEESHVAFIEVSAEGGLHTLNSSGLLSTYDRTGSRVNLVNIGFDFAWSRETTSAVFAEFVAFGGAAGTAVVDTTTQQVTSIPSVNGAVTGLAFARGGEVLVVGSSDGSVRTWDIESGTPIGTLWSANEATTIGTYDDETDSVWIAEPSRLLNLPLDPQAVVARACHVVSRDLTQEEWDLYIPGDGAVRSACS
jgi:serine/threonine protein kinase/WD40 repeat protein/DNA-binding winged helix-turn-helix (wHTH) protein